MKFDLPEGFLYGAASSAVQIESAASEDGKGVDCPQHFFKVYPEKFGDGDTDKSADFYHRYPEDIKMMKELGLNAFRFSISWARIYPNGPDEICQAGIDYYSDLMDKLKEAGISTFFDLWHCDMPYWVLERGGVYNPEFIDLFAQYAETCFKAFGDKVDFWSTINEPSINVMAGYFWALTSPFEEDIDKTVIACHNAILAHYKAVKIYKSLGFKGKIGSVLDMKPVYARSLDKKDQEAADTSFAFYSGWWLEPMFEGHYPKILTDNPYFEQKLPKGYEKDLADNFIPNDFISINFYGSSYAEYEEDGKFNYNSIPDPNLPYDDYGFPLYPEALFDITMYLHEKYPDKDIYITENGIGVERQGDYEAELNDDYRVKYLRNHFRSISRACKAGIPIKGYFHWSLMDTNEIYAGGYKYIFGLVQVRHNDNAKRVPRKSWYYYQNIIKEGAVD